jgi:precorrin-4 methylase
MKKSVIILAAISLSLAAAGCGRAPKGLPAETKLFLVGVGPCGPDLASMRAIRVIEAADVIVCYSWVKEKFTDVIGHRHVIVPGFGLSHYYGKKAKEAKGPKALDIVKRRDALVSEIRSHLDDGKIVAVLITGDPLIYSPWTWLLEEFADMRPHVVPGISSINAAHAAIMKSPVLASDTSSLILKATEEEKCVNHGADTIERLSKIRTSMVLLSANDKLPLYIGRLRAAYGPETPVAIVAHAGCLESEKVITGTLGDIESKLRGITLPTHEYLIYIGDFITYSMK